VRDKRGSAVSFTAWIPTKIGGVSARSPARNFTSLAAPNREGKGGEGRGGVGLYRGGLHGQLRRE
jgi:hypothetical protein